MNSSYNPLVLEVLAHRYLYYVLARPVLTDYDYDMLERLAKNEITYPDDPNVAASIDHVIYQVGSENPGDYPKEVIELAFKLLNPR